ncbi:MAG: PilW family protein [Gallionellaceae bacterium]|jgi:type IV pilus assembly protein PilW
MKTNCSRPSSAQTGFTLVEIMVGLTIGMLATLVIVQVMSAFEGQKRTTTGTADAQTNGSIALYNISRELQMAGYSLIPVANSALECSTLTVNGVADPGNPNPMRLSPVIITDGVSDIVQIRYGNTLSGGVPNTIAAVPTTFVGVTGIDLDNNLGCNSSDATLILSGTTCAFSSASAVPADGALASGIASATQRTITLNNNAGAVKGANLACLGRWSEITYRVNAGNLERQNLADSVDFIPIVAGIVNLQAQYGISAAANSNQIIQWVDATGGTWATANLTLANRNRIKAVRIAVVARNSKIDSMGTTSACSDLSGANPNGLCAWDATSANPLIASVAPAIDLTADPEWSRYRYRVFETIIPLRNVIWSRSTL